MTDRIVKTTLIIDDHGSVKVVHGLGDESGKTEHKLGGLDRSVKGLGKSFGGLKGLIGAGLGALGAGGLAFGLSDVASKTKEIAAETEKFHAITGIGAQSSLYYTQALKARGLSGESVSKAFGFLAKNIKTAQLQENSYAIAQGKAAAKGKIATSVLGRQATALQELLGAKGRMALSGLSEQAKLEKITKAFEGLTAGEKKTRLERELFGRGGNQLSTVLEKNNLGLSHQIELAKRFFPAIKGGAHAQEELLEKQAESKMAFEGLEYLLGQKLIPVMTSVFGWFSKTALALESGKGLWGSLGSAIGKVIAAGKSVVQFFEKNKEVAKALGITLGGIFAVEKVYQYANAIKGLNIAKLLTGAEAAGGASTAGGALGGIFGKAFIAAAIGAGIYSFLKNTKEERPLEEAWTAIFGGETKIEKQRKRGQAKERTDFLASPKHKTEVRTEERKRQAIEAHPYSNIHNPQLRHQVEAYERAHPSSSDTVHKLVIEGEGELAKALAKAIRMTPTARRDIAEGTAQYAQGMTARK